ncbi:unnamed protein product [Caenorhabditis auriculariae]|uniref:Uncharacterized protein n=1 Tax=Caenorhabditis auriculariae TaxID=2777116 RepID=A0A8S1HH14_9PELO|nr:unnamed protein product [Caenorhabditis auriculariae]
MPQCSFDSSVNVMRRKVSGLKNNSLKVSWMINRSKSLIKTTVELKKSIVRKSPLRLKDYFIDIFSISPDGVMMFIANG